MRRFQIAAGTVVALLLIVFVVVAAIRLVSPNSELGIDALSDLLPVNAFPTRVTADCSLETVSPYIKETESLLRQWDDGVSLAESTSRIALSPVVNNLQTLRRDALSLDAPDCASFLRDLQDIFMSYEIDAFLAFMQEAEQSEMDNLLRGAIYARSVFDEQFTLFQKDPEATYIKAHEWNIIVGNFRRPSDWRDVWIDEQETQVISIPDNWLSVRGTRPDTKIMQSPTNLINIEISPDSPNVFSDVESPLVDRTRAEVVFSGFQGYFDLAYARYGKNKGYLAALLNDQETMKMNGVVRLPSGDVYSFSSSKDDDTFTQEEKDLVYKILSSIRVYE